MPTPSMQARIARIGGRLKIQSRPGETRLSAYVAITRKAET